MEAVAHFRLSTAAGVIDGIMVASTWKLSAGSCRHLTLWWDHLHGAISSALLPCLDACALCWVVVTVWVFGTC